MLSGPLRAADDQLQMITATGRAVISHSDALNEAKNAALEDALYYAALSGGAKVDGFSSIQADTAIDDHFVVRPSSEILDYNIIDEMYDDEHYQVTVQAAVGTVEREGCQNRVVGHISMFAPSYNLTRHVPGWLSTTPQLMMRKLYDQMAAQSELTLTNYAGTELDVGALLRDDRYDYQTLTSSRPKVADGDFAFATEIGFSVARIDKGLHQQHFLMRPSPAIYTAVVAIKSLAMSRILVVLKLAAPLSARQLAHWPSRNAQIFKRRYCNLSTHMPKHCHKPCFACLYRRQ